MLPAPLQAQAEQAWALMPNGETYMNLCPIFELLMGCRTLMLFDIACLSWRFSGLALGSPG